MNTINLARARADLDAAKAAVEAADANVSALRGRVAEAVQRRADALGALRAGDLTEAVAAVRVAVAEADAADLRGIVSVAESEHGAAVSAQHVAEDAVRRAQEAVDHGERAQQVAALDAFISDAEQKLCRAIGLRHSLAVANGAGKMLSRHWLPCKALADAVKFGVPPAVTQ
ncbi:MULTISPECIES: hypothetical protein [Burkholderia cepacia complex]|uniref:hypothetical protein n=1 Tax=Burkholderia cepacia complex TaxID=87882 RepID=UPI0012DA6E56|nr:MULTISPECIES: hypothetical protein [Burkholderia cepacia complex]MBR8188791.1 hypothetical protein [Burkholderia vietnamiensis]